MSNSDLNALFINILNEIKNSQKHSFATIARLTSIPKDKIYNIIHGKSTPKESDLQQLFVVFPEYRSRFHQIQTEKPAPPEPEYLRANDSKINVLREKIALYEETKTAQRETIESLKAENKMLREIVELQRKLLAEQEK